MAKSGLQALLGPESGMALENLLAILGMDLPEPRSHHIERGGLVEEVRLGAVAYLHLDIQVEADGLGQGPGALLAPAFPPREVPGRQGSFEGEASRLGMPAFKGRGQTQIVEHGGDEEKLLVEA
jgi:hypothetical protein